MKHGAALGPQFWAGLANHVTATVQPVLRKNRHGRGPVIIYLRDLEALARRECESREVIQIIASARRLLGDLEEIELAPRASLTLVPLPVPAPRNSAEPKKTS